jgi:hypothetical protein
LNTNNLLAVFIIIALSPNQEIGAQVSVNNPYSRLGIGIINEPGSPRHYGMGSAATGIIDGQVINFQNPASYSFLNETVFQVSGKVSNSALSDGSQTTTYRGGSVNEIGMGFKKTGSPWGIVLGLTPYSTMGYKVETRASVNDSTDATYRFSGEGGINRLILGTARGFDLFRDSTNSVSHKLLIGANLNYLFGSLDQSRRVIFDQTTLQNTRLSSSYAVTGFYADLGIHYTLPVHPKTENKKLIQGSFLQIGMDYAIGSNVRTRFSSLGETFFNFGGSEIVQDTSFRQDNVRGSFSLPSKLSAGISYLFANKRRGSLLCALEYRIQNWAKMSSSDDTGTLFNGTFGKAETIALGFEYQPEGTEQATRFYRRMSYRIGIRQSSSYLLINGQTIGQQAISAGFSIPLIASRSTSRFHLGAEYGTGGTSDFGLIKEDFLSIQIGFTLNPFEKWFVRRKYD